MLKKCAKNSLHNHPDVLWQRCTVHFYRNILSVIPKGKVAEVATMLKAIHACEE